MNEIERYYIQEFISEKLPIDETKESKQSIKGSKAALTNNIFEY